MKKYDIEKYYGSIADVYEKFEEYNSRKHVLIKECFTEQLLGLMDRRSAKT